MIQKIPKLSLIGIGLLLLLVLFSLPSFSWWGINLNRFDSTQKPEQILAFTHPEQPLVSPNALSPLSTQDYILVDVATNKILLSKNSHNRIYPASTTKLATALTALNIYPLDEVISIGSTYSEGKVMELKAGEKITIRSLIDALLVYSANDSAYNLANYHLKGISGFVAQMNILAAKYNLTDTHFTNFDGIHNDNHYSSVYDLAQLGRLAVKNPTIREVVKKDKLTVTDITGQIRHELVSTNELLGKYPEIEGLKTGWTPEAGGCFVALINLRGHELISVVAQSPDRFADTVKILDWAKSSVTWSEYTP